jgi:hypothetical protein
VARAKVMSLTEAVRAVVRPGDHLHLAYSQARPICAVTGLVRKFAGTAPGFTVSTDGLVSSQAALVLGSDAGRVPCPGRACHPGICRHHSRLRRPGADCPGCLRPARGHPGLVSVRRARHRPARPAGSLVSDPLFNPRGVAAIGASPKPTNIGGQYASTNNPYNREAEQSYGVPKSRSGE